MRSVSILGATGSVGVQTLDIIRRNPGDFSVDTLTAHNNVDKLAAFAREFRPRCVVIGSEDLRADLQAALSDTDVEVAAGASALADAGVGPADIVVAAIVGAAGLEPTLNAVKTGKIVGLANKEALVCAGALMTDAAVRSGATLLPIDSEHNAIFQVLDHNRPDSIRRLILTASGGPFRGGPADLSAVTPATALKHPTWSMGAKISIDSATLMNKGLEVIEAYHLFPVTADQIDVVVHPQSIVHSFVEYCDGSLLAQMGSADMRIPIGYALGWPGRIADAGSPLDLASLGDLSFEAPDHGRFPCLGLARSALVAGGDASIRLNAANEVAVAAFLGGEIGFMDIPALVEAALGASTTNVPQSVEAVMTVDAEARASVQAHITTHTGWHVSGRLDPHLTAKI